ncbi:MAG: ATP-binding cassette domain-containing protein, partial [Gammaproteobacteria bacterium]|nr:ATP-binding cassette domain-containing protein [Gammaproteobacteria bacterium]
MSVLTTNNLFKSYNRRKIVNDANIHINSGEVVGLLGPNGAGKTTTFYMVVGLVNADKGTVFLDETDITHFPMHKRA